MAESASGSVICLNPFPSAHLVDEKPVRFNMALASSLPVSDQFVFPVKRVQGFFRDQAASSAPSWVGVGQSVPATGLSPLASIQGIP
jgi:hypothetical protein